MNKSHSATQADSDSAKQVCEKRDPSSDKPTKYITISITTNGLWTLLVLALTALMVQSTGGSQHTDVIKAGWSQGLTPTVEIGGAVFYAKKHSEHPGSVGLDPGEMDQSMQRDDEMVAHIRLPERAHW